MALLRMVEVDAYIALPRADAAGSRQPSQRSAHPRHTILPRARIVSDHRARYPAGTFDIASGAPLRLWVAGCATGEEVYSLAIVVREVFGDALEEGRVQIFGTDVSESAVSFARQGLYAASIADDVRRSGCGGSSRRPTAATR